MEKLQQIRHLNAGIRHFSPEKTQKPGLFNRNGVGWVGGNPEKAVPIVKYVVKISHKGLLYWAYSDYQKELSSRVLELRDSDKMTFKGIAEELILEGYRSPRGFDLGPESVFSIYKKRKIRDARMNDSMTVEILRLEVVPK